MQNTHYIKFLLILFILVLIYIFPESIFYFKHKKNPGGLSPENCLKENHSNQLDFSFEEFGFDVKVSYIPQSPQTCLCPGFPVVKFAASEKINAWIQVIETDSKEPNLDWFIDGSSENSPFYTLSNILSDTPNWGGLGYFYRFFTYFRARAYPINIAKDGTVNIYPAIGWGFHSQYLHFSLAADMPSKFNDKAVMKSDFEKIKKKFPTKSWNLEL